MTHEPSITTIERHFLDRRSPHASAEFSWLLSGITLATKIIAAQVQRAGLLEIIGKTGRVNVQGEEVQKLDDFANQTLVRCLGYRGNIGLLVSEEDEEPHFIQEAESGRYIVLFDPLDGSSNINANVSIGTIFSILERQTEGGNREVMQDILQPGHKQVAAGYVVYGSSTVLAYTAGDGVHMSTLDPSIGAYILTRENMRIPEAGRIYSANEAYCQSFPEGIQRYLAWAKDSGGYSSRYIGSLVADFHRTLVRGGVFLYPGYYEDDQGRGDQLHFIFAPDNQRILDIQPQAMHERTPLIIGSKDEVQRVLTY